MDSVPAGAARVVARVDRHVWPSTTPRAPQDLVEVLSKPFKLPKMVTQTLVYRNEKGEVEFEEIVPFQYHDGYLSVYFQSLS